MIVCNSWVLNINRNLKYMVPHLHLPNNMFVAHIMQTSKTIFVMYTPNANIKLINFGDKMFNSVNRKTI